MFSYDIPKSALIVASDSGALESISATCRRGGFDVFRARNDVDATRSLGLGLPKLVIIDVPRGGHAMLEWGRKLRNHPRTAHLPILTTCIHGDADMAVAALDAGMDDYVSRPFSSHELLARIRAVIRCRAPELLEEDLVAGPLSFRWVHREVMAVAGGHQRKIPVGPTEYRLLYFLVSHPETVHSRTELLDRLWPSGARIAARTVDAHIRRLRDSLAPFGLRDVVETVLKSGYRFTLQKSG
ncbi:winged helix-turn-helix domain-containing protein [Variovorax sp. ZS18.2.2]|uniref:winged helix-turn-helix domain-containing protein n=1 Tax=Variovorax sp. ZS18.2.2 TaxID=2971255 RepID=UPI002151EF6A|nr:winged helix-turn-helix domain-containing protein [Variovorax sp. ZS18.2.2]MCR6478067.1 winged helix-turn-helix domain-containing protein [Variovorax sp. ZS18.2.2]